MRRWTSATTLAMMIAMPAVFAAQLDAQHVNRRKPRTTTSFSQERITEVPIPGRPYGRYAWREVFTCNATWFSDGRLRTCNAIAGTTRWRLESNAGFADDVYFDPGPGRAPHTEIANPNLLLVRDSGVVSLVALPSGRRSVTTYTHWTSLNAWWAGGPQIYLAAAAAPGQPVALSRVREDGTVTAPLAGSDLRRAVSADPQHRCGAISHAAALPAEQSVDAIPGRPWAELRRMQLVDGVPRPADLAAEAPADERCRQYARQFYLARRSDNATWQVLDVNGQPAASAAHATAELAIAQAGTALAAKASADDAAAAEQRRVASARDSAAAESARRNAAEMQASIDRRQRAADSLVQAGRYAEAYEQVGPLSGNAKGRVALAWREAPVTVITDALAAMERDRGYGREFDARLYAALDARRSALASCEASFGLVYPPRSRWESTAPAERNAYMLQSRSRVGPPPRSGMTLAFDATRYEWVWIDYTAPTGVINVPPPATPYMRSQAEYDRCVRAARARD